MSIVLTHSRVQPVKALARLAVAASSWPPARPVLARNGAAATLSKALRHMLHDWQPGAWGGHQTARSASLMVSVCEAIARLVQSDTAAAMPLLQRGGPAEWAPAAEVLVRSS